PGSPSRGGVGGLEEAAEAAGLPSAQVEIDRGRLAAVPGVETRDASLKVPGGVRLSTGGPLRVEDGLTLFYMADASCRTCSSDLESLRRALPAGTRVVVVPPAPDQDYALRQGPSLHPHESPGPRGEG